jgi:hypothetical protein
MRNPSARRTLAITLLALAPLAAQAAGTSVRFDDEASPFPSNRLTRLNFSNVTFRQVQLPKPDCSVQVSDCADIDVINTLDGFSTQPRITVPFTGAIDVSTVNSDTVYLLNLGDTQSLRGFGTKVGINQVLWDPETLTLVFEPDELLAEHTRYLLVVTNGVRDAQGRRLLSSDYVGQQKRRDWSDRWDWLLSRRQGRSSEPRGRDDSEYEREVRDAVRSVRTAGPSLVAATVFTTRSTTGELVHIMRQIKRSVPAPASFMIGNRAGTATRAVFPLTGITAINWQRQTSAAPGFTAAPLPLAALGVVPGSVAQVAYGRFSSPSYLVAGQYMPAVNSLTGSPRVQGTNDLVFQLFVPAGDKPAGGWPVAIFGHGFTDSMFGAPWTVASVFASRGIATLAINVVGHGGGPLGKLSVTTDPAVSPVELPAGGRGFDQDGNGQIDTTEGVNATAPREAISSRDGLRQTVVDLMQLVRQVEVGMDVDGDGQADLNAQRMYYAGQSFGGIYGTMLLGVEPNIRAGVPNVPGGSITEVGRQGFFRFLTAVALATRQPALLNLPPTPDVPVPFNLNFNENIPLRDVAPVVNTVPGALAIAQLLDRYEWVQQSGNPVSYAPLIRRQPLWGAAAKPVIVQFAKGDQTVPNPTTSALIRAGGLQDRATYFRNDLAVANNAGVPKNPHTFLTNIGSAAAAGYAVAGQVQIAEFFKSDGALMIDPDGAGPFFETPIALPLPESGNFIP